MAVQIPDPGTGNGQTGDNEYVFRKKVKDNFSDQTNAASRIVGKGPGQLAEWSTSNGIGGTGIGALAADVPMSARGVRLKEPDIPYVSGFYGKVAPLDAPTVLGMRWQMVHLKHDDTNSSMLVFSSDNRDKSIYLAQKHNGVFGEWIKFYGTGNTTKEPTTGYLKAASPILHLFNDDLVKEHEAVEQDITVEKLGTGDYLIKGSTGLSNEGWNLSPPKDIHSNVLCMVEATEADGNINVKTYKRKFDFDIVAIVPDYDQPLDIPLGHSVDLRLNDLPQVAQQPEV